MITSFFQVALECFNRLISDDRNIVELGVSAITIMVSTGTRKAPPHEKPFGRSSKTYDS
jgi:hypothetical protein